MTTIMLVRHAAHDLLGRVLLGRGADVSLNDRGRHQAEKLAAILAVQNVMRIKSSPRRRAMETAQALAAATGLRIESALAFDELDFGEWNGCSFATLHGDPRWRYWNARRSEARPPGGESMGELQERVLRGIAAAAGEAAGCTAIITHAEPIRAAILRFRGLPLDAFSKIAVDPASLTSLHFSRGRGVIAHENQTVEERMVPA